MYIVLLHDTFAVSCYCRPHPRQHFIAWLDYVHRMDSNYVNNITTVSI